jgi:AcrR family transcriptional regulator
MSEPVKPSRSYDTRKRQEMALETRAAILAAARKLFLAQGYRDTSMAAIAAASGVHVDTIYAAVGRKPEILRLLLETAISGEDEPVPALARAYVREMQAEPDPRRKLARYARAVGAVQVRLAPIVRVVQEAAMSNPDLAALWTGISERRARNMRLLVQEIAATGQLRSTLTIDEAADIIWATNGPEFYTLMVTERGWSSERYEAFLADAWIRLLLEDKSTDTDSR